MNTGFSYNGKVLSLNSRKHKVQMIRLLFSKSLIRLGLVFPQGKKAKKTAKDYYHFKSRVEMFYLNTIAQLFQFVEQNDQL